MDIEQLAGTTLGNYEIESLLGKGGMGVVYKARQISLNRSVAIKILPPALGSDPSFVKRFEREAHAVARLNHQNIVHIYDIGEAEGLHFFSMEYVEGQALDKYVKEKGRLDIDEAIQIVSQAALAIQHAHENGITHRDIKPSNMMVDNRGGVKVMDFGLARTADDASRLTQTGIIVGTLHYMSPEQCRGDDLDLRTDIYSLGVALYEMLTGKSPFKASNEAALIHKIVYEAPPDVLSQNPDIPPELGAVVARAMAKNRDDRYGSVSEFLDDLHNLETVRIEPPTASRKPESPKPPRPKKRGLSGKAKLLIAASVLVILLLPIACIAAAFFILSNYDYESIKTGITQVVEETTGRKLYMPGDIEVDIDLTPSLLIEDVRFQNAPWGSRPELASLKRFEVEVALLPLFSGNLIVKRLILIEPDILIEINESGESNIDFLKELHTGGPKKRPKSDKGEAFSLTFNKAEIEDGLITYKDARSGKTYTIELDELETTSSGSESPMELAADGAFNNSHFDLEGTLGPLARLGDPKAPWRVNLTADAGDATINLVGAVKDAAHFRGIDLNLDVKGESVSDIARLAELEDIPDVGSYWMAVKITDPAEKTIVLSDLETTFGESNMRGSVEITFGEERPLVTASLASQRLDLRPFMQNGSGADNARKPEDVPPLKKDRVFSEEPLSLDVLDMIDAKADIQARRILLPRMAFNDLTADIRLDDGDLSIDSIKAAVGSGSLDGRLDLRRQGPDARLNVDVRLERMNLGRMLEELDIKDTAEGMFDADIKAAGRGRSVAEIMAGLNGRTIVMGKGRIKNKYIELLDTNLSAGLFRMLNPLDRDSDYTELNCFVSRFVISDGLATSEVIMADTRPMIVVGGGRINLKSEELNLKLKPIPKKDAGSPAKIGLSVAEMTTPFRLSGTFASPTLALDPSLQPITIGKLVRGGAASGPEGLAAALLNDDGRIENPCRIAVEIATKGRQALKREVGQQPGSPTEPPPAEGPRGRIKSLLRR